MVGLLCLSALNSLPREVSMCWGSSGDPGPRSACESCQKEEEKSRKCGISELCRAGTPALGPGHPRYCGGPGGCRGEWGSTAAAAGRSQVRANLSIGFLCLGCQRENPRDCKTFVEKQLKGKWSKPTNSTGSSAGGLRPLSPTIPPGTVPSSPCGVWDAPHGWRQSLE